jgi:TPR repeat protein
MRRLKPTTILVVAALFASLGASISARASALSDEHVRIHILLALKPSDILVLRKDAAAGDGRAMALIGEAYALAFGGLPQSDTLAASWLAQAAKAGETWAAPEASFLLFRVQHAADIAAAAATLDNGETALKGPVGGNADPALIALARTGLVDAQLLLAHQLASGHGAAKDPAAAAAWLSEAAKHGSAQANCELGQAFLIGNGVPEDPGAALLHYSAAAATGDLAAEMALGAIYARGAPGIPTNIVESLKWLALAASQGSALSKQAFVTLSLQAGGPETAFALKQAADWTPEAAPEF